MSFSDNDIYLVFEDDVKIINENISLDDILKLNFI